MKKILLGFVIGLTLITSPSVFAKSSWSIGSNGSNVNINYSSGSSYSGIKTGSSSFDDAFNAANKGATLPGGEFELPSAEEYNTIGENTSIRDFIQKVLNFILSFLGLIAIIAIIYAGYTYLTSGGDDGSIEKAKKTIIYAVIGLIVVVISYALVNTILKEAITGGDDRGEVSSFGGNSSSGGNTGGSYNGGNTNTGGNTNYYGKNSVKTNFAPGTTLKSGTKLPNGTTLTQDTTVREDGTVETLSTDLAGLNPDDPATKAIEKLLSFSNGIVVSGEGVNDSGDLIVISKESAQKGLSFGLSVQANALFDFGDGAQERLDTITSPGSTITHGFGQEQTYLVRAIAQTADGKAQTFSKTIIVGGITADFRLSKNKIEIGETVDATALTKTTVGSIKGYNWSCDGGGGCFPNIQGESISASFGAAGTYNITLEVENTLGSKVKLSKSVTVSSSAPTATFTADSTNNENEPTEVSFSAAGSLNTQGETTGLTYKWKFGNVSKVTSTPDIIYVFPSEGTQTISLQVSENRNGKTLSSEIVEATIEIKATLDPDFNIIQ